MRNQIWAGYRHFRVTTWTRIGESIPRRIQYGSNGHGQRWCKRYVKSCYCCECSQRRPNITRSLTERTNAAPASRIANDGSGNSWHENSSR